MGDAMNNAPHDYRYSPAPGDICALPSGWSLHPVKPPLWVVGQWRGETWELQGIFDHEQLAVDACKSDQYFVGPVDLNNPLPDKMSQWPGAYYPLVQASPFDGELKTPAPSPPSMVAEPAEAAILDELSLITHALRRNPDLRWRVLYLCKERAELEKQVTSRLGTLPIGTVDWHAGRVELPIEFDAVGYCECDE